MSRGLYTILGLFLTLTCWLPRAAWAQGGFDWELDRFDVHLKIQPDGSFLVTETIVADFSRDPHHGIFREIPYAYRRSGTQYNVRLQVRNVTDEHGRRHPFEQSRGEGRLRLKIGSAATLVNRPTTYVITYAVQRALLSFNTHDELYWNVTGNEWPIPIESTMFRVEI
ncbi:MAG TPA: DUF2207 domain-containing protein, partial [bacterium]|nr:DUF2207 domain-containing protein [bacterium]